MSKLINRESVDLIIEEYPNTDTKQILLDIVDWQSELGTSYNDDVRYATLDSVLDIIIDNLYA